MRHVDTPTSRSHNTTPTVTLDNVAERLKAYLQATGWGAGEADAIAKRASYSEHLGTIHISLPGHLVPWATLSIPLRDANVCFDFQPSGD